MRSWTTVATFAALLSAMSVAAAQMPIPAAAPPDGATLFKRQCATCHTLSATEPQRQGPTLAAVVGRKAGSVDGFKYSTGFGRADWIWDTARLDAWLTNPQAMIPGSIMVYRQANAATRKLLVAYLKDAS